MTVKKLRKSVNICQSYHKNKLVSFLADRTNGRAYATALPLSVSLSVCRRRLSVTLSWLNGRPRAKVTIESL